MPANRAKAFTLVELLITVSIIGIMATMMLFALWGAQETAKAQKTKALIAKLDAIIKAKWEAYATRRVPVNLHDESYVDLNANGVYDAGTDQLNDYNGNGSLDPPYTPQQRNKMRLDCLRDLMRMELPDRWNDVSDPPIAPFTFTTGQVGRTSVSLKFLSKFNAARAANPSSPSGTFAGAECLYMIVMESAVEDGDDRSVFRQDNFADTDGDGFYEFVDGWGRPIQFLRWPAGFQDSELQIVARSTASGASSGTVTLAGPSLNLAPGSYVSGSIMGTLTANGSPNTFDTNNMARITGWDSSSQKLSYLPTTASFSGPVVLTAADPFDSFGAYAASPTPNFATYPLIYSGGPDKCYGVMADYRMPTGSLHYAAAPANLNPFYVDSDGMAVPKSMVGNERDDPAETNYVPSAWQDNIHNHLIGLK